MQLRNAISFLQEFKNQHQTNFVDVFYNKLKLLSAINDINSARQNAPDQTLFWDLYLKDHNFNFWPTNQIDHQSLYMTKGPKSVNYELLEKFFFELLDPAKKNQSDIQYIVALGHPASTMDLLNDKDFIDYFSDTHFFMFKHPHDTSISVHVISRCDHRHDVMNRYSLHFTLTFLHNGIKEEFEKDIILFHIPVDDCQPYHLPDDQLDNLLTELLGAINDKKGVLIHCQAGLGRSGQLVATLLLAEDQNFEKIFSDKNEEQIFQNITTLIEQKIRKYRPGALLTKEQILTSIEDAIRYHNLKKQERENYEQRALDHEKFNQLLYEPQQEVPPPKESYLMWNNFFYTAWQSMQIDKIKNAFTKGCNIL